MTSGRVNPKFTLDDQGITGLGAVYYNLMEPGEGTLGPRRYIPCHHRQVHRPLAQRQACRRPPLWPTQSGGKTTPKCRPEGFDALYEDMIAHMKGRDYYVQDLVGGADPQLWRSMCAW
jgi:phosphoenolpyruvate carboxykinase (ATP)